MRSWCGARRSTGWLLVLLVVGVVSGAGRLVRAAAHGALDATFSDDGKRTIEFGFDDVAWAVAVQPDGKTILAGDLSSNDFVVARLNTDGHLDASFGGGVGRVTIDFGGVDLARAVAVQQDGKIVVAGRSETGGASGASNFAVARLMPNGTLDAAFGGGGKLNVDFGYADYATGLAIQRDGKIVVVGAQAGGPSDMAVARLEQNGALDPTFGTSGRRLISFAATDVASAVAVDGAGRIVVVGSSLGDLAVARLTSTGADDPTFGVAGKLKEDCGGTATATATGVAIQLDGQIVVVGYGDGPDSPVCLMRLSGIHGGLDTSFGGTGKVTASLANAAGDQSYSTGVVLLHHGKIAIGGRVLSGGGSDFAVMVFTRDGAPDTTFNGTGRRLIDFGGVDHEWGIALQPDGALVLAGSSYPGSGTTDVAVARVGADAPVDLTFNSDGRQEIDFSGDTADTIRDGRAVAVDAQGRTLVVGSRLTNSPQFSEVGIARLSANGSFDTSFGIDGRQTVGESGKDYGAGVAVLPDGRAVFAAYTNAPPAPINNFAVFRGTLDGLSFDPTFNGGATLVTDFGFDEYANAIALQPDGKTVVVGYSQAASRSFAILRLTAAGTLDTSFSGDGKALVSFGADSVATAVAIQGDGKIVVAGYTSFSGNNEIAIVRLLSNGSLDTSFNDVPSPTNDNGDGKLRFGYGSGSRAQAVALQANGRIVVAGLAEYGDFLVARVTTAGVLDSSFFGSGMRAYDFGYAPSSSDSANGVAIMPGGKIIVVGNSDAGSGMGSSDFAVLRLNSDSTPDDEFGNRGKLLLDFGGNDYARAVAVDASTGQVVVAGSTSRNNKIAVARLSADANAVLPVLPSLTISDTSVPEGNTGTVNATFTVTLSPASDVAVSAVVTTANGTATQPFDYTATNVGVLLLPGVTSQTVTVPVLGDTVGEANETFTASLSLPSGAAIADFSGVATIVDDDAPVALPTLSISDAVATEGDAGTVNAVFTVTLSAASGQQVSVLATATNGTAMQPGDFAPVSTTVTFAAGVTSQTVTVPVVGDTQAEGNETFTVTLSQESGATIADGTGLGTILDNEVTVTITSPTGTPTFDATQALVRIGGAATGIRVQEGGHVSWVNSAGGSGSASGSAGWLADIPLVAGTNVITVTAHETLSPGGATATDTITINVAAFVSYLAEGSTSDFLDTRFALLNPGAVDTTTTLTFSPVGAAQVSYPVPVPAHTQVTVDAKAVPGLSEAEFSTKAESSQPIVMDRTMSWDATGYGAHAETSVVAPSTVWYLAEGATHSGFDLFYLLQNPAQTPTTVRVRYLRPGGALPLEKDYVLPPTSRTNIWVNVEDVPGHGLALASTDVSAVITSLDATPIIVERALYLTSQGRLFNAGHESTGVTAPALRWFLAEGATGPYFDLYVLIANPNDTAAAVRVTYLLVDGRTFTRTLTAPANSRSNIWVDFETFDGGLSYPLADVAVSTTVSVENDVPVIVERALWWPGEFSTWHEAHNSAGSTTTGLAWALAEGEVGGTRAVETYVLVANPSTSSASPVKATLYFDDGTTAEQSFRVEKNSRFNIDVRTEFPAAAGRRFGVVVESQPRAAGDCTDLGALLGVDCSPIEVVVERAMYWDAGGVHWAAGTNALATRLR